jgi:amino acid transporter
MLFGYKLIMKTKRVKAAEADLWTDKDYYDRDEQYWKDKEAAKKAAGKDKGGWFYRTFVAWLF